MLKVGRLIKDSPVRWDTAYKCFMAACETTRPRFYEDFMEKNIPASFATFRQTEADLRVLGIGSGSGERTSVILKKILQSHSSVYSRVVEPSGQMLQDSQILVQQDKSLASAVKFDWRQQTAEEYFQDADHHDTKFHLAHALQVLYHVEDHHVTLRNMWEQLADGGYLFALLLSDKRGMGKLLHEIWNWFSPESDCLRTSFFTSCDVMRSLDSSGITYVIAEDHGHDVNLAECFKEGSEAGKLMLEFLSQTSNVYVYPEMKSAILEYCLQNSYKVKDKILFKVGSVAIVAKKNAKK